LVCSWDERFFDILTVYVMTKGGDRFRDIYKASGYRP
jgi:type IV secretory pathway VirB3-like protein